MFGHNFYNGGLRKAIVVVGTLFNDITISRESEDGVEGQLVRVPLYHGPREKYLARLEGDPNLSKKELVRVPCISFEPVGVRYDADRKLSSLGRKASRGVAEGGKAYSSSVWNPVPYDVQFEVTVYANNEEDASKIVDQVLPFFTPSWNATIKPLDDFPDVKTDLYVVLDSVRYQDLYTDDFIRRRAVTWQLQLTLKTYFFGPVSEAKVIKVAKAPIYGSLDATQSSALVTVRPGLTANGEPTTVLADSVPVEDIGEFDPWGYVVTVEEG